MNSRFEKLYSLPSQLYAPSMPVIIAAGALLKDTQTGKVLAQLKFKSISPKTIKAVTVSLLPLDTANQPLGEKETHQILDLAANRDAEFGQKTPLYFSNNTTRAYQVIVEEVVFSDNTVWKSDGAPLSDLPVQETAQALLSDAELVKQYKLEYGERADYAADTFSDLWRCNCGAVNYGNEANCHACGAAKEIALSFDLERLKGACQSRLEEERKEAAQELTQRKIRQKKRTIIGVICCVLAVAAYFVVTVAIPKIELHAELNKAVSFLNSNDYSSAENILDELDAEESLDAAKYKQAVSFFEDGKYIQAIALFERTHDYGDSADYLNNSAPLAAELYYQQGDYLSCVNLCDSKQVYPEAYYAACYYRAVDFREQKNYTGAIRYFEKAGDYLDAEDLIYACELEVEYEQAIENIESGILTRAITAFEELGNYESSSEYLALCKSCEKYNGSWTSNSHKVYDPQTRELNRVDRYILNLSIKAMPQRDGSISYKVDQYDATLSGNVFAYFDHNWNESCTFDLSTGVGRKSDSWWIIETVYEKVK